MSEITESSRTVVQQWLGFTGVGEFDGAFGPFTDNCKALLFGEQVLAGHMPLVG
ncbi:MAG: hypothetical protein AAF098_10620 [Pseudomonadota bacterium]